MSEGTPWHSLDANRDLPCIPSNIAVSMSVYSVLPGACALQLPLALLMPSKAEWLEDKLGPGSTIQHSYLGSYVTPPQAG